MAIETFLHSKFGEAVQVEFDINTANWRMSQVRIINNSTSPCVARIYKLGALVFTAIGGANQTTSWNTQGVQMGWDTVDGGLIMDGYIISAQWPGEV